MAAINPIANVQGPFAPISVVNGSPIPAQFAVTFNPIYPLPQTFGGTNTTTSSST